MFRLVAIVQTLVTLLCWAGWQNASAESSCQSAFRQTDPALESLHARQEALRAVGFAQERGLRKFQFVSPSMASRVEVVLGTLRMRRQVRQEKLQIVAVQDIAFVQPLAQRIQNDLGDATQHILWGDGIDGRSLREIAEFAQRSQQPVVIVTTSNELRNQVAVYQTESSTPDLLHSVLGTVAIEKRSDLESGEADVISNVLHHADSKAFVLETSELQLQGYRTSEVVLDGSSFWAYVDTFQSYRSRLRSNGRLRSQERTIQMVISQFERAFSYGDMAPSDGFNILRPNWREALGISINSLRRKRFGGPFVSYEVAKIWARQNHIESGTHWDQLKNETDWPPELPKDPEKLYLAHGWEGWPVFLGTVRATYQQARDWARKEGIETQAQWRARIEAGNWPANIPRLPDQSYRNEGWTGWPDFLDTRFVSYDEARKWAIEQGIRTSKEWIKRTREPGWPRKIPKVPNSFYKESGWSSWMDFLGKTTQTAKLTADSQKGANDEGSALGETNLEVPQLPESLPAQTMTAKTKLPLAQMKDILRRKELAQRSKHANRGLGLQGWYGFSGPTVPPYLSYDAARLWARKAGLTSIEKWVERVREEDRWPADVPLDPSLEYQGKGWVSWDEFFK